MRKESNILNALDWPTVLIYLALVATGWMAIYAVGYKGAGETTFGLGTAHGKQLFTMAICVVLIGAILVIDHRLWPALAYWFYALALLGCVAAILLAPETKGAHSWFDLGVFKFQPSEFAKFATALALARYLTTQNVTIRNMKHRLIAFAIAFVPAAVIILQNDKGSAIVFGGFLLLLYRQGLPLTFLVIAVYIGALFLLTLAFGATAITIGLAVVAAACIGWLSLNFKFHRQRIILAAGAFAVSALFIMLAVQPIFEKVLQPHDRTRINVLLGKEIDPYADYNVEQSKIAISSGRFSGKGFLQGTITQGEFVPEQRTDFVFSGIGEEFGFIGTSIVVILFVALLLRIVYLAERQRSDFTRIYAYGVASVIFVHFALNIAMVIGIFPTVGIPLPLVSYGGSALMGFTIMLFILLRLDAARMAVFR
jgi:rod shape determining protein RodA